MAYVYLHTRLDNNDIFYVGIGSDALGKYTRAFSKKGRSKFWKDMIKNREYQVSIIYDKLSWLEVCDKEIELIAYHGRKDLGKGTLVNLTNGGEGILGYIHTKEELLTISKNSTGGNNGNAKSCIHFDTNFKFSCLKEGCKQFNLSYTQQKCAIKENLSTAKFYFEDSPFIRPTKEDVGKRLSILRVGCKNGKRCPVTHIETELEFETIKYGCQHFNLLYDTECKRVMNNRKNKKFNLKIT